MYRNVKRQRHTCICIHAVPLNTDRPSGHTIQKIHRPHWAIFGLLAHSRGRRDTCKNEQKPCILQRSLTPRSITSDTVIRPVKLPKILDLGSLPEIDWRYNVKDQIVLPYVGVSVALLAALVIPIQRAQVHVDGALAHTLDVEAANIPGEVENIVRREDLLHTFALADVREHVAEHTRLAASLEVWKKSIPPSHFGSDPLDRTYIRRIAGKAPRSDTRQGAWRLGSILRPSGAPSPCNNISRPERNTYQSTAR